MSYEIVLDTETTGLSVLEGDRVIEIGALELSSGWPTGRSFHCYLNPGRPVAPEAVEVHGLTDAFLADKPRFASIASEFAAFVAGKRLVIHNAAFDVGFLNAEFAAVGLPAIDPGLVLDTLALARQRFPGAPASLDALCRRFGIDTSARVKHGALLDCELLAEVYLELIGGRQRGLGLTPERRDPSRASGSAGPAPARNRPAPLPPRVSAAEAAAHAAMVETLGPQALWRRIDAAET